MTGIHKTDPGLAALEVATKYAHLAQRSGYYKGSVEGLALTILVGIELGLSPLTALRTIHLVEGKPTLSADLIVSLVRASGACESWVVVEQTAQRCVISTKRRWDSAPTEYAYTMEDAQRAGLASRPTWKAHPTAMLRARCSAALARAVYPDIVLGLYETDEGTDIAARESASPPVYEAPRALTRSEVLPVLPAAEEAEPVGLREDEYATLRRRIACAPSVAALHEIGREIAALKGGGHIDARERATLYGDYKARLADVRAPSLPAAPEAPPAEPAQGREPAPPVRLARPVEPGAYPAWAETIARAAVRACAGDPGAEAVIGGICAALGACSTVAEVAATYERLQGEHPDGYQSALRTLAEVRESDIAGTAPRF